MRIDITHGVYRVLSHAKCYRNIERKEMISEPVAISTLEVLFALWDEDECRAAEWLAELDFDRSLVMEHFRNEALSFLPQENGENGENKEIDNKFPQRIRFFLDGDEMAVGRLEPSLQTAVFFAAQRLHDLLPQVVFATEHLLYALSLAEDEIGAFLQGRNATPDVLLEKICRLEGVHPTEPEIINVTWDDALPQGDKPVDEGNLCMKDDHAVVYRILDASANRAIEALRVLEDYARFGLDNAELVTVSKNMRHELTSALRELPRNERLSARNTAADVGTAIEGTNEYHRVSLADVLGANFSRLQESLRSLEEYGKIVAPPLARTTERLRYESYTLQKVMLITAGCEWQPGAQRSEATGSSGHCATLRSRLPCSRQRLARACLYVLVDCRETEAEFATLVQAVMQGSAASATTGADVIQLRDKQADDRLLVQRAGLLRELTADSPTLMIVNDRPDVALLCRADGVHVGQEEMSVADVRKLVGAEMLIGLSTHSIEQVRQAMRDGADYLGAGPVFPSATKSFEKFPGTDFLRQIAAEAATGDHAGGTRYRAGGTGYCAGGNRPIFAIGGINLDNLPQVIDSGHRRIAVQSVVTESQDPAGICQELKNILERHATDHHATDH